MISVSTGLTRLGSVSNLEPSLSSPQLSSNQQQHLPLSVVSSPPTESKSLGLGEASHVSASSVSLQMPTPEPIALPHPQTQGQSIHVSV